MMDKWTTIMIIGVMACLFSPVVVLENSKNECKQSAIREHMPADDILKLCK